jgi:hypothetical protein
MFTSSGVQGNKLRETGAKGMPQWDSGFSCLYFMGIMYDFDGLAISGASMRNAA